MKTFAQLEIERLVLQAKCDGAKSHKERNRLGQFATPPELAVEIMRFAEKLIPSSEGVRFLDPAFGTGSFFSALQAAFTPDRLSAATGFEIDRDFGNKASALWNDSLLDLRITDFTKVNPPKPSNKFNLVVCNPPYVRHHHLKADEKVRLRKLARSLLGVKFSGLTGLYCYFMLLSHAWASDGALCVWLVPSEFMDVNYGVSLKEYLTTKVTLLQIHRFDSDDVQFRDALVSSSIVCFRNTLPPQDHVTDFTFGGSLNKPRMLQKIPLAGLQAGSKWSRYGHHTTASAPLARLSDIFEIKRGLATGDNRFFILTQEQIREHKLPMKFFRPILPSPRYLPVQEVQADECGNPVLARQTFLLDCRLPEHEVRREHPHLWRYLQEGTNDVAKGYLCTSRSPWYLQENRPAPLFLCTYMGRNNKKTGATFRFILNHSKATAANVYLMLYPRTELLQALQVRPGLAEAVWKRLNAISSEVLTGEGRVYGGGLHKVEPRELGNVPADNILELLNITVKQKSIQLGFFTSRSASQDLVTVPSSTVIST